MVDPDLFPEATPPVVEGKLCMLEIAVVGGRHRRGIAACGVSRIGNLFSEHQLSVRIEDKFFQEVSALIVLEQ